MSSDFGRRLASGRCRRFETLDTSHERQSAAASRERNGTSPKCWWRKTLSVRLARHTVSAPKREYNLPSGTRGSTMQKIQELKLYHQHGKHVVFIAAHRGEELFMHFACQGIESRVIRTNGHAQLQ